MTLQSRLNGRKKIFFFRGENKTILIRQTHKLNDIYINHINYQRGGEEKGKICVDVWRRQQQQQQVFI